MSHLVRLRASVVAAIVVLGLAVGVPAFADLVGGAEHPPPAGFDRDATLAVIADAIPEEDEPDDATDLSDGTESAAAARALADDTFAAELDEPERTLEVQPGAEVERYVGTHAAQVDVPGSEHDQLAVSALPLRTRDEDGELAPVDLELDRPAGEEAFTPENPLVPTEFPRALADGVAIGDDGIRMFLRTGDGEAQAASELVRNKVFYPEVGRDADWLAGPVPTGAEALLQLRSADAAERHVVAFELPEGVKLRKGDDGGAEAVTAAGDIVARVVPPSAVDAAGTPVPVAYEVGDTAVTLVAEHRDRGFAYPILVDPVVEDWGSGAAGGGWFGNPALDQTGWTFSSSPTGLFKSSTQGTSVASFGTPPGRGLYVFAPPKTDRHFALGDYGYWFWEAPGQTTFIRRAEFRTMYFDRRGASPNKPVVVTGLYSEKRRFFTGLEVHNGPLTGTNATVENGDNIPPVLVGHERADRAVFGMLMPAPKASPKWTTAYLGGAVLYLDDPEAPEITRAEAGSAGGWASGARGTVTVDARDPGLGVRSVRLIGENGATLATRSHGCLGDRLARCPAEWTATFDLTGVTLPAGTAKLRAVAVDAGGRASAPRDVALRVDADAPQLTATGTLADADGKAVRDGRLELAASATDAASGVTALELRVDGTAVDRAEQACDAGGCPLAKTFSVDAGALAEGGHAVELVATDAAGNAARRSWRFTVDRGAPALELSGPLAELGDRWTSAAAGALTVTANDAGSGVRSVEVLVDGLRETLVEQPCPDGGCGLSRDIELDLAGLDEGTHLVQVLALDGAGTLAQETLTVRVDRDAPSLALGGRVADGGELAAGTHALTIAADDAASGVRTVDILVDGDREQRFEQDCADGGCGLERTWSLATSGLEPGNHVLTVVARDGAGHETERRVSFTTLSGDESLPPISAPAVERETATSVADGARFLYEGANAPQEGVAAGTIQPKSAAVLRATVRDRAGDPVAGVKVSVVDHPELGHMLTRDDGEAYLAVNGGQQLELNFEKDGFLSVQRPVDVPWQQWTAAEDVVLTRLDAHATPVDFGAELDAPVVHRATTVSDDDGERTATLLFEPGTEAEMVLPDGSTEPVDAGNVRVTEYTQGETGAAAMPGTLPPASAYTYAAEFGLDEAQAAGATSVRFSKPVVSYTDNFLGFPAGESVPVGYYDREKAIWVPAPSGRIVKVLDEVDGRAVLQVTRDGGTATDEELAALRIDEDERAELAELYVPGDSVWRVELDHFTPYDLNWNWDFPTDAREPLVVLDENGQPIVDDDCYGCGSILGIEDQTLQETLTLPGVPQDLEYQSLRAEGRRDLYGVTVRVTDADVPASLESVTVQAEIAGKRYERTFSGAPNQTWRFEWDGRDAFGRRVQGAQKVTTRVGYDYRAVYTSTPRFGAIGDLTLPRTGDDDGTRRLITVWREDTDVAGSLTADAQGLGGWTLSEHHAYDPVARVVHFGDGSRQSVTSRNLGDIVETVIGRLNWSGSYSGDGGPATDAGLSYPMALLPRADGSVVFADNGNNRIRRVAPDGTIDTIAGNGEWGEPTEGPAAEQVVPAPTALSDDGRGNLLILANERVLRLDGDGQISIVAGRAKREGECRYDWECCTPMTCGESFAASRMAEPTKDEPSPVFAAMADPAPPTARDWLFKSATAMAAAPDGNIYVAEAGARRLLRIAPDGSVDVHATGFDWSVPVIAAEAEGSVLVLDQFAGVVKRVGTDGEVTVVAGGGTRDPYQEPVPATEAELDEPYALLVRDDGTILIGEEESRILAVSPAGVASHFAGNGNRWTEPLDGTTPRQAVFGRISSLAMHPDGRVLVADGDHHLVKAIGKPLPGFTAEALTVASPDGTELYEFDRDGRHLRTIDALTGDVTQRFGYEDGRLVTVTDAFGDVTTISRDATGRATKITGPFGQGADLEMDAEGRLASVTNGLDETVELGYGAGGLLTRMTDARDSTWRWTYDDDGRLLREEDPDGGEQVLARHESLGGAVSLTDGEGGSSVQSVAAGEDGAVLRRHIGRDGRETTSSTRDLGETLAAADGTRVTTQKRNDTRFGAQAPYDERVEVKLPSGRTQVTTEEREVTLAERGNPLSVSRVEQRFAVNGATTTNVYDAATRTETTTTAEGRSTDVRLDEHGLPVQASTPGLVPTDAEYDDHGRPTELRDGDRVERYTYGADGNVKTYANALEQVTSFDYDAAGQLKFTHLPGARRVGYEYDATGNVTGLAPPGRPAHRWTYTPGGKLDTEVVPPAEPGGEPSVTDYDYDRRGELTAIRRPDGSTIDIDHDAAGRTEAVTAGSATKRMGYDGAGRHQWLEGPGGQRTELTYDGSLITRLEHTGLVPATATLRYGDDFMLAEQAIGSETPLTYAYDGDGTPTRVGPLTLTHDPAHGLVRTTTAGGTTTSFDYDEHGGLQAQATTGPDGDLLRQTTTSDAAGQITGETIETRGQRREREYRFDDAGRLTHVLEGGQEVARYGYDANGNRTSEQRQGGPAITAEFDDRDRLVRRGDAEYDYAETGELATRTDGDGTTRYAYNAFGDLTAVELPGGRRIEYLVDGTGARVGRKADGEIDKRYAWGVDLGPAAEVDADGEVVTRFVYATWQHVPDLMVRGGTTYRLVTDRLGSVRQVVDVATGEVAQELDYDEWGRVVRDTAPGFQPFGFTGGLYDHETGLVRLGARDYDAETGRWTTPDPSGFAGDDPNLYAYVMNDPVSRIDPAGLSALGFMKDVAAGAIDEFTGGASRVIGIKGNGGTGASIGRAGAILNPKGIVQAVGKGVGKQVIKQVSKRTRKKRSREAHRKGKAGDAAVAGRQNTTKYKCPSGRNRIPDRIDDAAKTMGEIKNVAYQAYTKQLKDMVELAQQKGYTFTLYVRDTAELSKTLQNMQKNGDIIISRFTPAP